MSRPLARPETPFGWMTEEFPALFDRLFASFPVMDMPERVPRMTVEESEKEIIVRAELPGFELAEVRVELLGDRLTTRQNIASRLRPRKQLSGFMPTWSV